MKNSTPSKVLASLVSYPHEVIRSRVHVRGLDSGASIAPYLHLQLGEKVLQSFPEKYQYPVPSDPMFCTPLKCKVSVPGASQLQLVRAAWRC